MEKNLNVSEEEPMSPKIYESAVIDAPCKEVWDYIRDFDSISDWHPGIDKSELEDEPRVGCVRRLALSDGSEIREKLLALSDIDYKYVYSILESPLSLKNYIAKIKLHEVTLTNNTFGEWYAYFDVTDLSAEKEVADMVRDIFRTGLESLVEHFGE